MKRPLSALISASPVSAEASFSPANKKPCYWAEVKNTKRVIFEVLLSD